MDGIMSSKIFTTRQGTILLGVIAAVIAAVALIVYLNSYRNSVNKSAIVPVLVAKGLIEKGTPGNIIDRTELYEVVKKPQAEVNAGALTDASTLKGQVALVDIYPGLQLTADDFGPATNSLAQQLDKNERAVSVPLGTPQQVGGQITAGSRVDVWVYIAPCAYEILHNAYVLSSSGGNATVRANPRDAGKLLWGSNAGEEWLTLAPTVATTPQVPPVCSPSGSTRGIGG